MKKSILSLRGAQELSKNEQKKIKGSQIEGWDKCCLREFDSGLPPYGCEAWIICDGL